MAYRGHTPAEKYSAFQKQDFTTSATTSYTLDNPVANANELALFINNVRQEPTTAYSANSTTLTLTEATSASDDMYCVYLGKAVQTVNPPNASVGTSQLADNGVTTAKIVNNSVTLAKANSDFYTSSTWTPTLEFSTSNGTIAYSTNAGDYWKIGTLVVANFNIALSSISGHSGNARISSLPYTAATSPNSRPGGFISLSSLFSLGGVTVNVFGGTTFADLLRLDTTNYEYDLNVTNAHINGNEIIRGTIIYKSA